MNKSISPSPTAQRVRDSAWPWDSPLAPSKRRPFWHRVLIQLCVMGAIAALFFAFGKRFMTYFILGLAALFLFLACVSPTIYRKKELWLAKFARAAGHALTHILLVPFYWLCFVPAHFILRLRGKDPMNRQFPAPQSSCWHPHRGRTETRSYERQY